MITLGPDFRVPSAFGPLQVALLILVFEALRRTGRSAWILTSWSRSMVLNEGARERSLHLESNGALAMDVVSGAMGAFAFVDFLTNDFAKRSAEGELARAFRSLAPPFTQAVLEGDHVHLELDLTP